MANTLHPTQLAYLPTGSNNGSTLYLGRNIDVQWEAIGFGLHGRPDYLEKIILNLTKVTAGNPPILTRLGTITLDVADLQTIIAGDGNAATPALSMKLKEVAVCDNGQARKMIILASNTYV